MALETGDFRLGAGNGSLHSFLLGRVMTRVGGVAYSIAEERKARTYDNEAYRVGDPIVLVRLLDRSEDDPLCFTLGSRVYLANGQSVLASVVGSIFHLANGQSRTASVSLQSVPNTQPPTFQLESASSRLIDQIASH